MDKKIYEDEVELKKALSKMGYRYGELGSSSEFVVIFRDNKAYTPICRGVYTSPIEAVRNIGNLIPTIKLPIEDIDIQLAIVYDLTNHKVTIIDEYTTLSPYLYYKKKEINGSEVIQSKEQEISENSENN